MLAIYSKFLDKLETLEKILLAASSAAMVVIIVYQVILRYCFNASNSWSEELARYLFIYDVMLLLPNENIGNLVVQKEGGDPIRRML